ncbi:hypothetical protein BJX64DRAFT_285356 [Aspergillus heterothallicus]
MSALTFESLPGEIIVHIVILLLGYDPRTEPCAYMYDPVPSALCLVNRRLRQLVTPLLYANFTYNSNPQKIQSLWLFGRTLVEHPDLARLVRQVDFTSREIRFPHQFTGQREDFLRHLRDLYRRNLEWLVRAYRQAGWDQPYIHNAFFTHCRDALEAAGELPDPENLLTLEAYARRELYEPFDLDYDNLALTQSQIRELENRFRQSYLSPLFALIYAHCPDLLRTHVHVAPNDFFHGDIVSRAGYGAADESRPQAIAFQKLESISIKPATSVNANGTLRTEEQIGPAEITLAKCYYRLPKIKELFMMPARVRIGRTEPYHVEYDSPIQKLTLDIHRSERFDYNTFFPMLKNLRQLSLVLPRTNTSAHGPLLYTKLWTLLAPMSDNLEYLDIHQDDFLAQPGTPAIQADTAFQTAAKHHFCAPFARFHRLTYLAITPLILYGHQCNHREGTKLATHLPPNLLSLALYTANNSIERDYIIDLPAEQTALVAAAAARGVKCITLDSDIDGPFPLDAMVAEAQRHPRLSLQYNEPDRLVFGGKQAPFMDFSRERLRVEACRLSRRLTGIPSIIPRGMVVFGWKGELGLGGRRRRAREGVRDAEWAGMSRSTSSSRVGAAKRVKRG